MVATALPLHSNDIQPRRRRHRRRCAMFISRPLSSSAVIVAAAVIIARSRDRQSSTRADDNLFVVKFAYRAVIIIAGPSVAQTNIPSVCDDVVIFRYFGVLRDSIMLDLFVCWVFVVRFSR